MGALACLFVAVLVVVVLATFHPSKMRPRERIRTTDIRPLIRPPAAWRTEITRDGRLRFTIGAQTFTVEVLEHPEQAHRVRLLRHKRQLDEALSQLAAKR